MLLFKKHYLTDSQFLLQRNTFAKTCDKHLLVEKMPLNSVASQMRLTFHKPQQKYIHCKNVPTDKFLTSDKTKYGENSIVSQMTDNDEQKLYVTSVTTQC